MRIVYYLLLTFLVIYIFEYTSLDFLIQNSFYDFENNRWMLDKFGNLFYKYFFYNFSKALVIVIAMSFLYIFIASYFFNSFKKLRKKSIIIFLCISLTPMFVSFLKKETNISCPRELLVYQGDVKYKKLFEKKELNNIGRCFPAGHASGGFALLILTILARNKKEYFQVLAFTSVLAFSMAIYKMAIGDHFLSHTLVSFFIALIFKELLLTIFKEKNENFNN